LQNVPLFTAQNHYIGDIGLMAIPQKLLHVMALVWQSLTFGIGTT